MRGASLNVLVAVLFFSCQNSPTKSTYISGTTNILVDESIAPIIEDQAYIFENTYADAKLNLVCKSENELMGLFLNDSIRIAILSRELTKEEASFYQNRKVTIRTNQFATDAIALITHQTNPDSTITTQLIYDMLQGKKVTNKTFVLDNKNSSTVRYFKQLANVANLPSSGVYALQSNADVIKYVYEHPNAIGVVGVNWIYQPDKNLEPIVAKLRVMGVKNIAGKLGSDAYYKPSQNNIAQGLYPFTRSLYVVNCEGGPTLGAGFASFLASERGQRMVLKSGLLPYNIPSREVIIKK